MRKVIVTFNIIWDYHTRLPKMFWYVTACKNINLGIYNKQIRFYAPRTSLETMSDVLNLCIKNKCPKNHDWAFIFHNWELKLKIEYFMVLKLQITQKFLCLLSRGSGPPCNISVAGKISHVVEPVPTSITMRLNTMNVKVIINEFVGVIVV